LHPQGIRDRRPHPFPGEHVAVGDIKGLIAAGGRGRRPFHRTFQQVDVDHFENQLRTARIRQWQTRLAPNRRVYADRWDHIEIAADCLTDHKLRPENRPVPLLALLCRAQVVLLQPVEILMLMARRAFLCG
jgi:hypothetical protein